jgi:hypothetical protein
MNNKDEASIPVCECGKPSPDRYPCLACARREKLAAAIAAKDAARGRPLTATEMLENLRSGLEEDQALTRATPQEDAQLSSGKSS